MSSVSKKRVVFEIWLTDQPGTMMGLALGEKCKCSFLVQETSIYWLLAQIGRMIMDCIVGAVSRVSTCSLPQCVFDWWAVEFWIRLRNRRSHVQRCHPFSGKNFSHIFQWNFIMSIQECIPVGCVPLALMAISISGGGGVQGVCPWTHPPGHPHTHPTPWTQRQTPPDPEADTP